MGPASPDAPFASQTNITGNVTGPVLSGTFHGPVYAGDTPPPPPHQLPPPPADFVGRTAEKAELLAAVLTGGVTIAGLRGLGGVGKTALALTLAAALTPHYPDAQFFLDLQGISPHPLAPSHIFSHIISAYHPTEKLPENEAELRGLYRSVLHGKRALILLDNAKDSAQVEPLLPPPGCLLLITSRQHLTLPGLHATHLDALPRADACALLLKIAPRIGANDKALAHADALAALCGNLPYALRLAASTLHKRVSLSVEDYLRRLQDAKQRLSLIDASLTLSYDLLTPELQKTWRMLAVFPTTFDRAAACAVLQLENDAAQDVLDELIGYSLVDYNDSAQRYGLHDLARLFADARLSEDERDEGQRRHAGHYERVSRAARQFYEQGGESITRGLALFDLEWPNIQVGQAWAAAHAATDDEAAQLCSNYPDAGLYCFVLRLHPHEQIRWLESALTSARRLKWRRAEGIHLGNLGVVYKNLGDARRAIQFYEQALVIDRESSNRRGEGAVLGNLGNAYKDLGDTHSAIEFHKQSLAIAREIGDQQRKGAALGNLGIAYKTLGNTRQAIEFYEQQLVIMREIGDQRGEGLALGNIGNAYAILGDARRAIAFYEQTLVINREMSDQHGEGNVLGNLGSAYAALGDTHRAIECHEQSLIIKREIGDRRGEGDTLFNLALALNALNDRAQAIARAESALKIYEQIESPYIKRVRQLLAEWQQAEDG